MESIVLFVMLGMLLSVLGFAGFWSAIKPMHAIVGALKWMIGTLYASCLTYIAAKFATSEITMLFGKPNPLMLEELGGERRWMPLWAEVLVAATVALPLLWLLVASARAAVKKEWHTFASALRICLACSLLVILGSLASSWIRVAVT